MLCIQLPRGQKSCEESSTLENYIKYLSIAILGSFILSTTPANADREYLEPIPLEELISVAYLDEIPFDSCPTMQSQGEKVCSGKQESDENDYQWMRRVQKAALESAKEKFEEEHGSATCPREAGECIDCKTNGSKKKGTCILSKFSSSTPSQIPGTGSTTYNDGTDEICSQVSAGCPYTCKSN